MSVNTLSPGIWSSLQSVFDDFETTRDDCKTPPTADDLRRERAFVQEAVHRNPDAFKSDLDVFSMMHMYPGRF